MARCAGCCAAAVVRDGDFIDQRPLLPPARAVTAKTVLGAPRPEFRQPKAAIPQPTGSTNAWSSLPQPDPQTGFKVKTMAPALSMMQGGGGPSIGIKLEDGYPTYRPNDLQKDVIKEYLATRGMPTKQLDDLKIVPGLDKDASIPTWLGYHMGRGTVTQGNTVYTHPEDFIDVAQFNSDTPFEEAYHAAQFASDGGAGFYRPYVLGMLGGAISGKGAYNGIPYEAFAKGAAKEIYRSYRYRLKDKPE